ncbi:MAG: hypothetical protein PHX72_00775 [Candidatus Shapirobacteria bacterium]|nr:hypothetical protein [Candidatus Shapirobacteria bacterium]
MISDTNLTGVSHKEKEPKNISREDFSETADIIEIGRLPEIAPGVEGYLEKIEKEDYFLSDQVVDDQTGQPLVTSIQPQKPKIILPLTLTEYNLGLKESIENSWRWLAEWSKRLIKMLESQVGFKSE